jgi:hypothetical protein
VARSPELVADRRNDRHRQVGGATEGTYRDRLEPTESGKDRLDATRAFDETDCLRDLLDDGVSQRHVGRK